MDVSPALILFWGIVVTRFVLPLWIPRFPLPAIVACLVVDAIDQPLFQTFTSADLSHYQGYDKALDIFYLSVAMLTMYRNWNHWPALQIGRYLFYARLIGVLAFELTSWRPLLFFLPNAFEYYFIFYEALRSRWSPRTLGTREYAWAAVAIWILKLPQEYWIHIARLDFTDVLKNVVLDAPETAPWPTAIRESPISFGLMIAALAGLVILARTAIYRFAGAPEHALRLVAPPLPRQIDEADERDRKIAQSWRLFDLHLVEKCVLVAFITVIFAQIVPGVDASPTQLVLGTAIAVTINAFLGLRRARGGGSPESFVIAFVVLAVTNAIMVAIAEAFLRLRGGGLDVTATMFFLLLLTLVVTQYDRWRPVSDVRFARRSR